MYPCNGKLEYLVLFRRSKFLTLLSTYLLLKMKKPQSKNKRALRHESISKKTLNPKYYFTPICPQFTFQTAATAFQIIVILMEIQPANLTLQKVIGCPQRRHWWRRR